MPIHDWTRVIAGVCHDFHNRWITHLAESLNAGVLPAGYYALSEQQAAGFSPTCRRCEAPASRTTNPTAAALPWPKRRRR